MPLPCSRQQLPAGERADRGLPHRVLQRDLLQDERLQSRRGDAEVVQVYIQHDNYNFIISIHIGS